MPGTHTPYGQVLKLCANREHGQKANCQWAKMGWEKKNKMAKPAKYTALGSRLGKLFVLDMGGINRAGI